MFVAAAVMLLTGCIAARKGVPVVDNPVVEHYRKVAENIAFPAAGEEIPAYVPSLGETRPLVAPKAEERRLISLADAIRIALDNNQIIRQNAQFLSPQNPVLTNPDGVPSVFDANIQNLGIQFGARGTAAALSDFDPRITATVKGGRDAVGQNSILQQGAVFDNNNGQSELRLDQQLLSGGIVSLAQSWTYSQGNAANQLFPSAYSGTVGAEFRQPLWQGFGRDFTAIAGPLSQQARGFSFVNQGIVIARINNRIAEIDIEENLQNLVREIGDVYWDLYQNYHEFDSENENASFAKKVWDLAKYKGDLIGEGDVAQAEDAFHEATARKEQVLGGLLQSESRLRRLLGLPITDGKYLFPIDQPQTSEVRLNRVQCLFEAMTNRLELRRQKTNLRSLELQLTAAKNLANPRLDLVAGYNVNGFGRHLMSGGTADGVTAEGFNNAYASLLRGKETSWNLGLEYSVPLWLRSQRAQVNQLEFRLIKGRRSLAMQEDEIARELYSVLQTMQQSHAMIKTNMLRVRAARRRVAALKLDYEADRIGVDPALRAEMSQNQATIAYYRSLSEYNKAIRDLLYRMGRLLSGDGIELLNSDGSPVHPDSIPILDDAPPPIMPKPMAPPEKLAELGNATKPDANESFLPPVWSDPLPNEGSEAPMESPRDFAAVPDELPESFVPPLPADPPVESRP